MRSGALSIRDTGGRACARCGSSVVGWLSDAPAGAGPRGAIKRRRRPGARISGAQLSLPVELTAQEHAAEQAGSLTATRRTGEPPERRAPETLTFIGKFLVF